MFSYIMSTYRWVQACSHTSTVTGYISVPLMVQHVRYDHLTPKTCGGGASWPLTAAHTGENKASAPNRKQRVATSLKAAVSQRFTLFLKLSQRKRRRRESILVTWSQVSWWCHWVNDMWADCVWRSKWIKKEPLKTCNFSFYCEKTRPKDKTPAFRMEFGLSVHSTSCQEQQRLFLMLITHINSDNPPSNNEPCKQQELTLELHRPVSSNPPTQEL